MYAKPSLIFLLCALSTVLLACTQTLPTATPAPFAQELILYDWADYMPQSILDAFTAEYGIKVSYQTYTSQEEAVKSLRANQVYDVVILDNDFIPPLVGDQLLAPINYQNVPNFKNVSANFRDLVYDPGNQHSVLLYWGTTGLIVRNDLVKAPVTRWSDLWNPAYAGKVAIWPLQRYLVGIALKSLGYSANSENPRELNAALEKLLALKPHAVLIDLALPTSAPLLAKAQAVMSYGWTFDVLDARSQNLAVNYILPAEGSILWGENVVIPANSPRKRTAELFLNFLLRPEISARIANERHFAISNEAAFPLVKPEILHDPVIFSPSAALKNAEILVALSPVGQKRYADLWQHFMNAQANH
ncbi:MAG: spermidine/putrescine ABC transporter substrate-binding protein [Caldilineaceae bacterium]